MSAYRIVPPALALLLVLAWPARLVAGDVDAGLIRGGIGVAGVELGMTEAQVRAVLGDPVSVNKTPSGVPLYLSYHATEIFGVYLDEASGRVRMLIVAVKGEKLCTRYGACLYREGDLARIKRYYGAKLRRFVDRDGSVTYRRLAPLAPRSVMTEFTPAEDKNAVVQVAILYWDGKIDDSALD